MIRDYSIDVNSTKNIVIYGAGDNGKAIGCALLEAGVKKFLFLDKNKAGETLVSQEILDPDKIEDNGNMDYIIGTGKYCNEAYDFLRKKNISEDRIFTAITLERLGNKKHDLGDFDYEGSLRKFSAELLGEIYMPSLDLVITECCTLRCQNCSNLMQYYLHPVNCEGNVVLRSLQNLLNAVSFIGNVRILGGEPFVNQKLLIQVLKKYCDEDKIASFVIVTNGTILPNDGCIKAMSVYKSKVKVAFSNYGVYSNQLEEACALLKENEIPYTVITDNNEWMDYGAPYHYKEKTVADYQLLYKECTSRRYCNTLFNGYFYLCPRAAHGERLGVIPVEEKDGINFSSLDMIELQKEKLMDLLKREKHILACEYCNWKNGQLVPKAVQSDTVLEL